MSAFAGKILLESCPSIRMIMRTKVEVRMSSGFSYKETLRNKNVVEELLF